METGVWPSQNAGGGTDEKWPFCEPCLNFIWRIRQASRPPAPRHDSRREPRMTRGGSRRVRSLGFAGPLRAMQPPWRQPVCALVEIVTCRRLGAKNAVAPFGQVEIDLQIRRFDHARSISNANGISSALRMRIVTAREKQVFTVCMGSSRLRARAVVFRPVHNLAQRVPITPSCSQNRHPPRQ